MIANLPKLIGKYQSRGLLLDSNLLVLLFIGLVDPSLVDNFKRTKNQGFTDQEFSLLRGLVGHFSRLATTPHILTETSNYVYQLHGETRQRVLQVFDQSVQTVKERRVESRKLVHTEAFYNFGLTDCAIMDLPPKQYLVLSVDAALVIALQKKGVDAINFNHLRQLNWQQ